LDQDGVKEIIIDESIQDNEKKFEPKSLVNRLGNLVFERTADNEV